MHAQPDLFSIDTGTRPQQVFPEFEIERPNCDYSGKLKLTEMSTVLESLGFHVGEMRHHTGTELVFPVGAGEVSTTLFEASYPDGWVLTDDMASTIYTGDNNPVRQIIDSRGHLRGLVHCGLNAFPLSATLYTRYAVWDGVVLGFAKLPFARDGIRSIVVDRTKIDPQHPDKIDDVEHIDRRWLIAEEYSEIHDVPLDKRFKWVEEHVPFKHTRLCISGGTLWLDEHFPDWRNPAAYWQ